MGVMSKTPVTPRSASEVPPEPSLYVVLLTGVHVHVLELSASHNRSRNVFDEHQTGVSDVGVDGLVTAIVGRQCHVHRDVYVVNLSSLIVASVSSGVA